MYAHVKNTLGMSSEQLLAYMIENEFDLDKADALYDECESQIKECKEILNDCGTPTQSWENGGWSYGSYEMDRYVEEKERLLIELTELRDESEQCYSNLDNYLYKQQMKQL